MSDQFTNEDIRIVARALAPELPEAETDLNYFDDAYRVLTKLSAAGRIVPPDATTEWAWRCDECCEGHPVRSEAHARYKAAEAQREDTEPVVLRRWAGPWQVAS